MRTSKLTASTLGLCLALGGPAFARSTSTTTTTEKPNGQASPSYSVRPNGAVHQWRKDPPRKLSVGPGS
jgi:hypothetical protein